MLERTITQTAIRLGNRYGRCIECGHIQWRTVAPCLKCEGEQIVMHVGPGIPPARGNVKAEGTVVGYLAAVPGLVLCLGVGLVLVLLLLFDVEVTWKVVVAVGLLALLGILLVALGFSLISREAAPWIGKVGEWVVRLARVLRKKNGA